MDFYHKPFILHGLLRTVKQIYHTKWISSHNKSTTWIFFFSNLTAYFSAFDTLFCIMS